MPLGIIAGILLQEQRFEVPIKLAETAILADATINGRKLTFMFDTGFSGSFVVESGISLGKPDGKMNLRDFVGEFQADTVNLKTIQIGPLNVDPKDKQAVLQPLGFGMAYNSHCDGIMGFEVVRDHVLEINFQQSKFIFHPKATDISKRTPDNDKTFLLKILPIGHGSLELEVGTPTGKKMVLALDTGNSFYATSHRDVLERVGLWPTEKKPKFMSSSYVASGPVDTWYKQMKDLTIFGVKVPSSYWSIIDLPSSSAEHDGTIGFGFLKNFNVTIDFNRRRVWMENFTGKYGNDPIGKTGLVAAYDERSQRVRVFRVTPDSPAAAANIQAGDSILSINGKEMLGAIGHKEVESMLDGAVGSKVSLSVSQGTTSRRVELERIGMHND